MMELTRVLNVPETLGMAARTDQGESFVALLLLILAGGALLWLARRLLRGRTGAGRTHRDPGGEHGDIDTRMRQIEYQLQKLILRVDQVQLSQSGGSDFGRAIRLVHRGAGAEQLIERCGLTRGEAELFQRLHGPQSPLQS